MNIAYSLSQLGHRAIPFVMSGMPIDSAYKSHIRATGIDPTGIVELERWAHSSHAFIFTDRDGNQFTAFYSGPAATDDYCERFEVFLNGVGDQIDLAILAPDIAPNMIGAASLLRTKQIPFLCDPGQQISDFTNDECEELVQLCRILIGNFYEIERIRSAVPNVNSILDGLIVTNGAKEIAWRMGNESGFEPAVSATVKNDPTGCGDAFRAGFAHAWMFNAPWQDAVRSGAVVATMNMACRGSQSHDLSTFGEVFQREWGYFPSWQPNGTD